MGQEEVKGQILLAVGHLEAYVKKKKADDDYFYEQVWLKPFKSQTISIDFSQSLNYVAVGCDDGTISISKLDQSDPTKREDYFNEKVHSARVMRVLFAESQNVLYSIGEDKMLRVIELQSKVVIHEVTLSSKKLTEMVIDKKNRIGYVGDRGGCLLVVSLSNNPPILKQSIRTSSEGAIRGLDADFDKKLVFCCCEEDSYVHIFKLHAPTDPEGRLEKLMSIKGSPGPRVMRWWADRNELVLGHKDGLISVINYDVHPTGPIFSAKSHSKNVNAIQILPAQRMIVSASGDKCIKVGLYYPVLESTDELGKGRRLTCL